MTAAAPPVRDSARAAHAAGLCVLPPKQDGSKQPDVSAWTRYQRVPSTEAELARWYADGRRTGLGVVCGAVSGGLECLEFEDADTWRAFREAAEACGLDGVVERVVAGYCDATPGSGFHLLYRCSEVGRNMKLARRPKSPEEMANQHDTVEVTIETRGEGGYVISAPSSGQVHPSGKPYVRLSGDVATIATITPEERADLFALARAFDEMPTPEARGSRARAAGADGTRPGDAFNRRADWAAILTPHGWTRVYQRGDVTYWRRPGKDRGVSATTNYAGSGLLYVFTSSTPLEPERSYTPFGAYAVLDHRGDFAAASRALGTDHRQTTSDAGAKSDETASGAFGTDADQHDGDETWPERQPLPAEAPAVPALPAAMVPEPLRAWIVDIAGLTKLPVEMVAVPAVVAAGAVIGRRVGLKPGRFDDFTVVPNIWGQLVARPGWMKSAAVKEGLRPLGRLAAEATKRFQEEQEANAVRRERIEAEIDAIKAKMREAARKDGDLDALEERLAAKRAHLRDATPRERRYFTHDATVEKLGELLKENPRGMLVVRDELSGWLRALDKPGREGDREFFLEAWNGTGSFTTDRIGRGTIHIPALTLSMFGGIQPGKLRPLMASAVDGGTGDDGLLQRFQLTVWPDRLPPWQKPERWPDADARNRAATIFAALDDLTPGAAGAESDDDIPYLRFTQSAQALFDAWRDELEHRLRSDDLDGSPAFAAHLAKYRSLMPALALIFHLIDVAARAEGAARSAVDEASARMAAAWCEFLECHARKLYAVELHAGASAAHALATKIAAGAVIHGQAVRELYRSHWAGLATPERVLSALNALADLGWLRVETVTTGGRPSQIVRLHPDLRREAEHD